MSINIKKSFFILILIQKYITLYIKCCYITILINFTEYIHFFNIFNLHNTDIFVYFIYNF